MKAYLKQYQQAPRKVRLIADAVRGERLDKALTSLEYMPKKAARQLQKLLKSALANAGSDSAEKFFVATLMVDEGPRFRRARPGFKGSSDRFYRRTSHVTVELGQYTNLPKESKTDTVKTSK